MIRRPNVASFTQRHGLWLAAVLLLALGASAGAGRLAAQGPAGMGEAVTLAVQPAFGGYFKYGEWLPLRVTVANNGPDLDGEVRVAVTGAGAEIRYVAAAPLPSGARKDILLYTQLTSFSKNVKVDLVVQGQVVQSATANVQPLPNISYVVGLVAPDGGPYAPLEGLGLAGAGRTVKLVPLALADLPERAAALRTFDALIINDTDTVGLSPLQSQALQAWAATGGRLVVGGGPGAERTLAGLPAGLKPAGLAGREAGRGLAALAAFGGSAATGVDGDFVIAAPAADFGRVLAGRDGRGGPGLIHETRYGEGYVDYLVFDPGLSPFSAWAGMRGVWSALLSPGSTYPAGLPPDANEAQMMAQRLGYSLTNLPSLDLPSVRWLAVLLGVYILLIGPTNYLVLRRLHRLEWAWVSVPALTLVFAGGAFGLGYRLRGNDVIINQVSVVQVGASGAPALIRTYAGIFSPNRSPYSFTVGGGALAGPMAVEPSRFGGPFQPGTLTVVEGEPTIIRDVFINQWSMQGFQAERYAPPGEWGLTASLGYGAERVTGTIHNGTPYDLSDLVILMGSRFARVGDVAAGSDLHVDQALAGRDAGAPPFPYQLFQDTLNKPGPNGAQRAAMLKQNLLEAIFSPDVKAGGAPVPGMALIAWFNASPIAIGLNGGPAGHQHTSVLVVNQPIAFGGRQISLPAGLVSPQPVEFKTGANACGPAGRVFVEREGAATLDFELPQDVAQATVTRLVLAVTDEGNPGASLPNADLYDWAAGSWVALAELHNGDNEAGQPARFVSPAAVVRLRLRGDATHGGTCALYDLALDGEQR